MIQSFTARITKNIKFFKRKDGSFTNLSGKEKITGLKEIKNNANIFYNGEPYKLVWNPIAEVYWIIPRNEICYTHDGSYIRAVKCDSLKFICFIIPKNACSSILETALYYDNFKTSGFASPWINPNRTNVILFNNDKKFKDYKYFIILENDIKRFVRALNFEIITNYQTKHFNLNLSPENLIKERLLGLKYYKDDCHFIPQETYIENIIKEFFNGSQEEFEKTVEIISLKDFPVWFKNTFGVERICKNVMDPSKKPFVWENMPQEQKNLIINHVNQKPCRYQIK